MFVLMMFLLTVISGDLFGWQFLCVTGYVIKLAKSSAHLHWRYRLRQMTAMMLRFP